MTSASGSSLDLHDAATRGALSTPRLERAIGVIYRPETERVSHYLHAHLPRQFDGLLHIDETHALEALEPRSLDQADLPDDVSLSSLAPEPGQRAVRAFPPR